MRFFGGAHANAEHWNLAARALKACQQAGLCASAASRVNHATDIEPQVVELVDHLQRAHHIAQCANRVGAATGNDVRLLAFGTQRVGQLGHGGVHVGAAGQLLHIGAVKVIQKHVARLFVVFYG